MAGQTEQQPSQPTFSVKAEILKSLNGTELKKVLSQLPRWNQILPQEAPSLNPSLLQSIQNVIGLSGEKSSAEAAGAGENVSVKTTTLNPPGIGGRESQRKENMMAGQIEQPSQPHSQQAGILKSLNGTELNELLSQLQGGNEILPQEAPSLNPSLLQAIQNFISLSGEKPSTSAAGAGENVSEKTTTLNSPVIGGRESQKKRKHDGRPDWTIFIQQLSNRRKSTSL